MCRLPARCPRSRPQDTPSAGGCRTTLRTPAPPTRGGAGEAIPPGELGRGVNRVVVAPWVATVAGAEDSQRDPVVRVAQVGVDRVDVLDDRRRVGLDLLDVGQDHARLRV